MMINKEYGSDFQLFINEDIFLKNKEESLFYGDMFSLFFSGRVALYNLLEQGINNYKWKKIYLPSFYCHEVTEFIKQLPIEILYYEYNPFLDSEDKSIDIEDVLTNVIVNVNFFGIKKLDLKKYQNAIQIEDITHSILSFKDSQAHYCFGSLRKELPVPVGGFCFSPRKLNLPIRDLNIESEQIAIQKLSAMFLKSKYLEGSYNDKDSFRKLFMDAENNFAEDITNTSMPESAKAILNKINIEELISIKHYNISVALKKIIYSEKLEVNIQSSKQNIFGILFKCKNLEIRNELKNHLVENMIFPAILWPNQFYDRDKEIEKTILFLHMDYRYSLSDIEYIISKVNDFIQR